MALSQGFRTIVRKGAGRRFPLVAAAALVIVGASATGIAFAVGSSAGHSRPAALHKERSARRTSRPQTRLLLPTTTSLPSLPLTSVPAPSWTPTHGTTTKATPTASPPAPPVDHVQYLGSVTSVTGGKGQFPENCAVLSSGGVDCWGSNLHGALGNGSAVLESNVAVPVTGLSNAMSVAPGIDGACAVIAGGRVECWGDNSSGQLGIGTSGGQSNVPVAVPTLVGVLSIASDGDGDGHGYCAVLAAGGVECWGDNSGGELGIGSTGGQSNVPVAVAGITDAVSVAGTNRGYGGYCALLASGGVDCWGDNTTGELGDGSTSPESNLAAPVTGVAGVSSLGTSGFGGFCAVETGGTVACWGNNAGGMLGNGSTDAQSDVAVAVTGVTSATSVSGGGGLGYCAVLTGGGIDCWGEPEGDGSATATEGVAAPVTGISNAISVTGSAAWDTYCAVLTTGGVDCWGWGGNNDLGSSSTLDISQAAEIPVPVTGITNASVLASSAGGGGYCALLKTGLVSCWGDNQRGELGTGSTAYSSAVPGDVALSI
jgi:alpha-tubulin suppressor-like RCC1 family protein